MSIERAALFIRWSKRFDGGHGDVMDDGGRKVLVVRTGWDMVHSPYNLPFCLFGNGSSSERKKDLGSSGPQQEP